MRKLKAEKGESVIPKGAYCYSNTRMSDRKTEEGLPIFDVDRCPYWDSDENRPDQYDGYCWFIEKGDWDLNSEKEWKNQKTGEIQTGDEIGLPMGLLWDGCKECGVKDDEEN